MNVRRLLIAGVMFTMLLIAARLVALEVRLQEGARLDRSQLAVGRVVHDATGLLLKTQHPNAGRTVEAENRWRQERADLVSVLASGADLSRGVQATFAELHAIALSLPESVTRFETESAPSASSSGRQQGHLSTYLLISQTQKIVSGAESLARELSEARRENDRIEALVTRTTMAAFALLVLALSWVVARKVLTPISALVSTARAVRMGDLTARSNYRAVDEIGLLAKTMDSMAGTLDERTSSLESARRDLQNILDAVPSVIGYWDRALRNRFANHAYREWFGRAPESLRGTHISEILGEQFEASLPRMEAALRGEPQVFERSLSTTGGSGADRRHTLTQYIPDMVDGQVRGFYSFVHDITQQTEDKALLDVALRENEALLSTIRLHAIFSVADVRGRIIEANDNFCRITGYSREELIGENHRIVNSGTQDRSYWVDMWRTIGAGQPWRGEVCNRAKDGSLYWVDSIIAPFIGADGRIEKYISIRTDITAAKRAEQKLRASEAFLERAGQIAGVGGWEIDLHRQEITWSSQTYKIHEVEQDYRPNLEDALSFYPAEARQQIESALNECVASGRAWDLQLPFVTAKGRAIWVRSAGAAEHRDGKAVRVWGAFQDITERREAKEALQKTNDRFSIASDAAQIGVWELDTQSSTLTVNEWMYRLFKRPRLAASEPLAPWLACIHADDRPRVEQSLQASLESRSNFDAEFRIVWPDGEVRHMRTTAQIVKEAGQRGARLTGVSLDMTDRKRAELELFATSSMLQTVLESASEVSIIATDADLNITMFNAGAERLLGYRSDEVVGKLTPMVIHDAAEVQRRSEELSVQLGRSIEGGAVFVEPSTLRKAQDWIYVRKDGSHVPVSLVVTAMHADAGDALGYLGIAHDVTRQKEYEESLRLAMHKAKQASLAKSQFLANMSHEIRTPMNAVVGLSYLLGQTSLDNLQSSYLSKMTLANRSLLALINDILDLSKIEAGELTIERAPFSLPGLLHDLTDVMKVQADAKGIGFSCYTAPDVPHSLEGDATRLGQILTNLIANAIKFTDQGRVWLRVSQREATADTSMLVFEIRDTGIGIAPEAQSRLFAPFVQADSSMTRRFGGTGLGLSIVKRLVDLMRGEVSVCSAPGEGSEFRVEMTFSNVLPDAIARRNPSDFELGRLALRGVNLLVVDDSEINLEVARRILETEGAQVTLACNGQQACDLLQEAELSFDAVLMDVQMPVMDGYQATRFIRDRLGLASIPVLALTAGALTSERQLAVAAGMNDFITKPFDPRALVRSLCRHVRPLSISTAGIAVGSAADPSAVPEDHWPPIEGIDEAKARERFLGDAELFKRMLKRMLEEFEEVDVPDDLGAERCMSLAARMHKLKGGAGMLGATRVQALAAAVEMACDKGEHSRIGELSQQLERELRRMRTNVSGVVETPVVATATSTDRLDSSRSPFVLSKLVELLEQQSMSALDEFASGARQLRHQLGPDCFELVRDHVENLRFGEAATLLGGIQPAAVTK